MIAALYIASNGSYVGVDGVDPWDEARDARTYPGPYPIVAHPPCQRWGKFWAGQPLHIKRTGERKIKGDDGGCFAAALAAVRRWGGVLEHPWDSHAWAHFGLNKPPRSGGWVTADFHGGWTCCVEQGRYGHYARKPTLLLAYHVDLPDLSTGARAKPRLDPAIVAHGAQAGKAARRGRRPRRRQGQPSQDRHPAPFSRLALIDRTNCNQIGGGRMTTLFYTGYAGWVRQSNSAARFREAFSLADKMDPHIKIAVVEKIYRLANAEWETVKEMQQSLAAISSHQRVNTSTGG
jgi:hypothetical protein